MKIELSPEREAEIQELMRLWGFPDYISDDIAIEAAAMVLLREGVHRALETARKTNELLEKLPIPQSVPAARVFEDVAHPLAPLADGTVFISSQGKPFTWRDGKWVEEGGAK